MLHCFRPFACRGPCLNGFCGSLRCVSMPVASIHLIELSGASRNAAAAEAVRKADESRAFAGLLAAALHRIATQLYMQASSLVQAAEEDLYFARTHLSQLQSQAVDRLVFDALHARWTTEWAAFVRALCMRHC